MIQAVGTIASRREWRRAIRSVSSEIPSAETVQAEGPGAFMFSDGRVGMWVEAHLAVTENRVTWAMPKSRRAGVVSMPFDQVVKYIDQEPGIVALTTRDPNYAASLNDPTNPHGETDVVFRFDGYEVATSTEIRGAIEHGVRVRGNALPGSLSDYLPTDPPASAWPDRSMGVSPVTPTPALSGYQGQATDANGRTIYPWQSEEFSSLRADLRSVSAPGGGLAWQELKPGDTGYFESIAFVLNKHLGWSGLGRRYLIDLAEEVPKDESVGRAVSFLTGPGRDVLISLRGDPTEAAAQELASRGVGMLRFYTGADNGYEGAPDLARVALDDALTADRVREVPSEYLPSAIAGFGKTQGDPA